MFKASFQLPTIIGEEIYPEAMQAPPSVRVYVDTRNVPPGQDAQPLARDLVAASQGRIAQFVQAARQLATGAGNTGYTRQLEIPGIRIHYNRNYGHETITLFVTPGSAPTPQGGGLALDIRTDFFTWPIPGSQHFGDPPPQWEFGNGLDSGEDKFYSFYDPAFGPGDRDPTTPPVAAAGAAPTDDYTQHRWFDLDSANIVAYDPSYSSGYVSVMWLKDIGGTGFYEKLLSGKQYWEVEIMRLPSGVPENSSHPKDGSGAYPTYEDPTVLITPTTYTRKWPTQLNTFLNPVIGVIPKHFAEPFTPPDHGVAHTPDEIRAAQQLPMRDTFRFTHKLIGLDPTLNQPRSIGAVRSSTMVGNEATTTQSTISYWLTIPTPHYLSALQDASASDVLDNFSRVYTTNFVLTGGSYTMFNSDTQTVFFLGGPNPYWDLPESQRPVSNPDRSWSLHQFSIAGGQVYIVVDLSEVHDPSNGTPSGTGPWTAPSSGPPVGFLTAGAPAARWPATTGPFWRNAGTIGGAWYGPAYVWCTSAPTYDTDESHILVGATSETRNGVALGLSALFSQTGGDITVSPFNNQVFGDFLRQPAGVPDGGGEGGTIQQPREVVIPYHAGPGRTMPVIKGRGDFIDQYRDVVTTDSNYDPGTSNHGYDTGVDLGEIAVGDRIMIATDTKTGEIWFGKDGVWKGPGGGPADPAKGIGAACLMDRVSDVSGLKDAEYYAACSYRYGPTWMRMHLGAGLKHKPPASFKLLGVP